MSYFMLALATADFVLFIWAFQRWTKTPGNIALLLSLAIILPVGLDALLVGAGRWMGAGPELEYITRIRFTLFIVVMPLLILISVLLLRYADIAWTRRGEILPLVTIGVIAASIFGANGAWEKDFYPSCVFDVVRYVMLVPEGQACASSVAGQGQFSLPIIVPLSSVAVLITGGLLLWKHRWPWLLITQIMLMVAVAIPPSATTIFVSYPFDAMLSAALAISAIRFFPNAPQAAKVE